ncbi:MAG: hypothetical protein HFE63_06240 [Clostridiales bacterium]|nr:hypothetical protein [Clostridiales bacterium]
MKKEKSLKLKLTTLLLCVSLASVASCGQESRGGVIENTDTEGDAVTTEPVEVERDRLNELGDKDFDGRVFMILDANDHPDMHVNMPGESENGDIVNDALFRRDRAIEAKYNINIDYVQMTWASDGVASMKNSVLANDDEYSLCIAPVMAFSGVAREGILANLSDVPYLSLSENWWSSLMYDNLRLNDIMYYTTGDISPSMYQMASCMYVNLNLMEDFGFTENFPQLVRDGKWTWDVVERLTKDLDRDLNDDGKLDTWDDFIAVANAGDESLAVGNNVNYSKVSDDGKSLTVDYMNEHTVSVIEAVNRVINSNVKSREFNDVIHKLFMEDRALFLNHFVESSIVYLRDMESDYLILPFPKFEESQETYRSFCNPWADAYVAIPENVDEEFVGFITEALGYYSYKNVRHQTYNLMLKQKVARDEDNTEMLDYVFNNLYLDFNSIYDFGGSAKVLTKALLGKAELASSFAGVESKVGEAVDKFIAEWNRE